MQLGLEKDLSLVRHTVGMTFRKIFYHFLREPIPFREKNGVFEQASPAQTPQVHAQMRYEYYIVANGSLAG